MDAKLAMEELGIKLSDTYLSIDLKKPENRKYIKKADLILTLTEKHKKEVSNLNEAKGKTILTIREYGGESGDIKDPSMKGVEGFRIARDEIIQNLLKGLDNY
jgi:protein-tyrosine-phosphatase